MRARMTFKIRAGLRLSLRVAQVNRTGKIVETSSLYVSRNLRIKRLTEAQRCDVRDREGPVKGRGLGHWPGPAGPAANPRPHRRPHTNIAPT